MATETKAPLFIGVGTVMIILPTIAVALRIASRTRTRAGLSWDDWLCVACLPIIIVMQAMNIDAAANHGLGYHHAPLDDVLYFERMIWILEILYMVAITLIKLSVLLFYKRVFKPVSPTLKIILWTTGGVTVVWAIVMAFVGAFQCTPVEATWDTSIPGTCIDQRAMWMSVAIPNVILDVIILIIPIRPLLKLSVAKSQKIGLVAIFILGYFVPIMAIVRLAKVVQILNLIAAYEANPGSIDLDITWTYDDAALWSMLEPALGLFSCCIPGFQYLFTLALERCTGLATRNKSKRTNEANLSVATKQVDSYDHHSFSRLRDDNDVIDDTFIMHDADKGYQADIKHVDTDSTNGNIPMGAIHRRDDINIH